MFVASRQETMTRKESGELPRVLFIEDNPADAQIVRRMLEDAAIAAVETAYNVEQGLRMFRQAKWDLLLVDYRLPGSDGLEALERVRELDPNVPTVMLTGLGDEQVAAAAIKRGADEYLSKDTLLTVLPTTVRTLLEAKWSDERLGTLLKKNQRDEELRKVVEAEERLVRSLPPDSATADREIQPAVRRPLISAFARLYHAVATYSGGLPGTELSDIREAAKGHHLSSRQLLEFHTQAVDQVIQEDDLAVGDLASRLDEGLLLALLWLNDS
jgi:DNA-binding NarL/FixJ family response regulator